MDKPHLYFIYFHFQYEMDKIECNPTTKENMKRMAGLNPAESEKNKACRHSKDEL
jgi:hypothetical protein